MDPRSRYNCALRVRLRCLEHPLILNASLETFFVTLRVTVYILLFACLMVGKLSAQPSEVPDTAEASEVIDSTATPGAAPTAVKQFEWLRNESADTVICPFRGSIDYQPGEIECGLIQVPENREVAGSRTIELHYVRLVARGKDAEGEEVEIRDDPIVYLTGGPGVAVTGYVSRLKDHSVLSRRDLYILEQRGIGFSGDFCPFYETRNRDQRIHSDFATQQMSQLDAARECARIATAQGVDLRGYHTFENARDVRALRVALGLEQWNVWGISYGSVLGQALVRVDPQGVQAMVIDAIVPLDLKDLMRIPTWYTRLLDRLFSACEAQSSCAAAYPDLRQRYMAAIASIRDNPITLQVEAGERYPAGEVTFFHDLVAGMPFGLMYEQSTHAAMPAVIEALVESIEEGNRLPFQAIAQVDTQGGFSVSAGMSMAVHCLDGYMDAAAASADSEAAAHPLLAEAFGSAELLKTAAASCREMGIPARDPEQFQAQVSEVPTLIANGAWDPITPPPLVDHVLPNFSNVRYVEFPHAGHGPTRSLKCAGDFLNAFFDDPQAELDMDCVETGEQAAVYLSGRYATEAVPRALIMLDSERPTLIRHAVWCGASLLLAVIALPLLIGSTVSRRLDGRSEAGGSLRLVVFLAALASLLWALGLGWAAHSTSELTPALLLFGMVPWAASFAWLAPLSGLLALIALVLAWQQRGNLPRASLLTLPLVALACISVSVFAYHWDLWP